jgi:GxxExxY protein
MYEKALVAELRGRGISVGQQVPFRVFYKGEELGTQVVDVVVDSKIIVECKSCAALVERDGHQLTGYLRFTNLPLGLLMNFNVSRLKDGIVRKVNWPLQPTSLAISIITNSSFVPSVLPS